MHATHQDAERRYEVLRRTALDTAQRVAATGLRYEAISAAALNAVSLWRNDPNRQVDWDWVRGYADFRFRYPKRFELALWDQADLVALSLGRPTYEAENLRLDFLEARPRALGPRPLVLPEVLLAYSIYARLLNAKYIRIMSPLNERVRSYYESFGYVYVAKGDFLYKLVL